MSSVGPGVIEIRIHAEGEFRVFFVAKFSDGVHILHACQKKTQRASRSDLDLVRKRYSDLLQQRSQQ